MSNQKLLGCLFWVIFGNERTSDGCPLFLQKAAAETSASDPQRSLLAGICRVLCGRPFEAAHGGPRQQQIPAQKLYSIQCDRQAISAMQPGPAASVNRNPCNFTIAATMLKPRPRPLVFRLLSER